MPRNLLPYLMTFLILPTVGGCFARENCDEYRTIVRNSSDRAKIVQWADEQIFSRTFSREDFEKVESFVGPGKGGANFDLVRAGISLAPLLEGYTVRAVGPNRYHPDVIFLGKRRYQGILITREEVEGSLRATTVDRSRVEEVNNRVAMMCYTED